MLKKKSNAAQRAWHILRLALLWARKGGVFKRRLMMDMSLVSKYLKSLGHTNRHRHDSINYGREHELSFDETPIFHVKMHRPASLRFKMPHIPCLNPQVDFDYDFEFEGDGGNGPYGYDERRESFLKGQEGGEEDYGCEVCEENIPSDEEGIDVRAEEFIANFYKQMKMQRQISYLKYNDMLSRSSN